MRKSVALAVAVLALAGCGAPEKDAEYQSLNDFAAAYEDALSQDGVVECRRVDTDLSDAGWGQTQCGQRTVLMLFTSDEKRDEIFAKNPLEVGERWIQGPNWALVAPQYEAEAAREALGGSFRD
ncbi:hypothetical protein BN1051_03281 [Arthrobacter saudimassiliensis]|uniref:Lipoprotein n=1 Tax=Arthrobacter saudimassiliensis TaxID=1461584 RepID=A0A078MRR1_9MICC|nr:hypothetical protein BN1051_03281 [Arthrobacter saudimassiliensis]